VAGADGTGAVALVGCRVGDIVTAMSLTVGDTVGAAVTPSDSVGAVVGTMVIISTL
jgi:hypothetical protein